MKIINNKKIKEKTNTNNNKLPKLQKKCADTSLDSDVSHASFEGC